MSTRLDFQLKLLVYQKQLELSFFQNVAKKQSVPFSSYIVFVIRCKVIINLMKALYLVAKQETLTPPGHLVSPLVCRGP